MTLGCRQLNKWQVLTFKITWSKTMSRKLWEGRIAISQFSQGRPQIYKGCKKDRFSLKTTFLSRNNHLVFSKSNFIFAYNNFYFFSYPIYIHIILVKKIVSLVITRSCSKKFKIFIWRFLSVFEIEIRLKILIVSFPDALK